MFEEVRPSLPLSICPDVVEIDGSNPCSRKKNEDCFFSLRTRCSVLATEAVKGACIKLFNQHVWSLLVQASRIPYFFDEKAEMSRLPKEPTPLAGGCMAYGCASVLASVQV
jgi:hypothetical protein